MALVLANMCTWWQVFSALVYLMVYQISKVCLAFMYIQHRQIIYGKLHRHHDLVLDQNEIDNAYSTPLLHKVWNMDHKMVILEIDLCYNKLSHLCVQHQHYLEHDTICLSILFHWILFVFARITDTIFAMLFCQMLLKLLS